MTVKSTTTSNTFSVKKLAGIAVLGALSFILMLFEFPIPIAPVFYKLDFSEVSVMIGGFALGPAAGIAIEALKIVIYLLFRGTRTAFVGEFASFVMGCALTAPAAFWYQKHKTKKGAITGMAIGIVTVTIVAAFVNAFVMLPMYSSLYGTPMDVILGMGAAIVPAVKDVFTFCLFCVVPFNVVKGLIVSVVTALVYKHVSPILH